MKHKSFKLYSVLALALVLLLALIGAAGAQEPQPSPPQTPQDGEVPLELPKALLAAVEVEALPIGSFNVSDGPYWGQTPPLPTYTCLETCALLFGGSTADYYCSTESGSINHLAWASTWGSSPNHCKVNIAGVPGTPIAEDYKLNTSYVYPAISTYVGDWCGFYGEGTSTNYCFLSNQPPTADPNGPYTGFEGSPVEFDGTGSSDPDGDPLTYDWDFGDGSPVATDAGPTPSHTYDDNASYTLCLTVTDPGGLSDTQCTTAEIANVAPTATFNAPIYVIAGDDFELSLTDPYDPSLADTAAGFTYEFDCGDGAGYISGTGLLGSSQSGQLFSIDPSTGAATLVGIMPGGLATEIEYDSLAGKLYAEQTDGGQRLYTIDPETGASLGFVTHALGALNGLEFVGTTLYGTFIPCSNCSSTLVTVDTTSGNLTSVGPTGFGPISGLAYDVSAGVMYGITAGGAPADLVTIDLGSGAATAVGPTGFSRIGSIEFGPDGYLYGGLTGSAPLSANHLVRIDPATAVTTVVGDTGFSITGLTLSVNNRDNSATCSTAPDEVGDRTVKGKIQDKDGGETEYTATVTILPPSAATNSALCYYDKEPEIDGQQFRLIFTPDMQLWPAYKLPASNPGQFFYNVFYTGAGPASFDISVPAPFETQGATPVHVYTDVSVIEVDGFKCFVPDLDSEIYAGDFSGLSGLSGPGGFLYVTVHLDYGLKGTTGYLPSGDSDALDADDGVTVLIPNLGDYTFSVSGSQNDSRTIQNSNDFKKIPGFGGLVTDGVGDPVIGATAEITLKGEVLGQAMTDEDGWYMFVYKYTGRPATYTVELQGYGLSESGTLKANKFAEVNFVVP